MAERMEISHVKVKHRLGGLKRQGHDESSDEKVEEKKTKTDDFFPNRGGDKGFQKLYVLQVYHAPAYRPTTNKWNNLHLQLNVLIYNLQTK